MNKKFIIGVFFISCCVATGRTAVDAKAQISYWAPGIVRPAEGTMEMDVEFLSPRSSMLDSWNFLFRLSGNSPGAGATILGLVFCPPEDPRNFAALARGLKSSATINVPAPNYALHKPIRVAMTWGKGQISLWFDGKIIGREGFSDILRMVPEKFLAGFVTYSGFAGSYRIKQIRISDTVLPGQELIGKSPFSHDTHTTLLINQGGKVKSGEPTEWQKNDFISAVFPVRGGMDLNARTSTSYVQPLCLVNFSSTEQIFHLSMRIKNRAGVLVDESKEVLKVPANTFYQPGEIVLTKNVQSGYFQAELEVRNDAGHFQTYQLAYVGQNDESLAPGKFSNYLGHHKALYSKLGYQWIRAWEGDRVFLWSVVEPSPGDFQWEAADRYVKEAREKGLNILGLLGYPPAWASTYSPEERDRLGFKPDAANSNSPDRYQPKDIEEWKTYVRTVVARYHDTVKFWEIYNEVDFHPPGKHATFSGSTLDYLELLRAAHQIIKEIDPTCQVLTSGFSLQPVTDPNMVADLMKAGAADAFDILNVHGYTSTDTLEKTLAIVRAAKPGVPVWQSERAMMGGPNDDYLNAKRALWMLDKGYEKYFFHGEDLERDFGGLYPNSNFAVTAELSRQLRPCDEYLGPIKGIPEGVSSWVFKRTDGSVLRILAVDIGSLEVTFESGSTPILVTDLYGETIFRGVPDPAKPLVLTGLSYISSAPELRIAKWVRIFGNAVANPGFEIREGDFQADASLARPAFWSLRSPNVPEKLMSFVPGHSGKYALKLQTPGGVERVQIGQDVTLPEVGEWILSASLKAPLGAKAFVELKTMQNKEWFSSACQKIQTTGDWQKVSLSVNVRHANTKGLLLFGLLAENGEMEIDDVELIKAPAAQAP